MAMNRILVPSRGVTDWPCAVGGDALGGRARAAQLLARAWQEADGFPPIVQSMFSASGIEALETAELLFAVPGWEAILPGGGEPHVSDLLALATCEVDDVASLLTIVVESYGGDGDDDTVAAREAACRPSEERRLAASLDLLDLCHAPPELLDEIPCPLLEHTAATAITAREFASRYSLTLGHGFDASPTTGVGVVRLAGLLTDQMHLEAAQTPGGLVLGSASIEGATTYLAWVGDRG
jgi:hypothetical protein